METASLTTWLQPLQLTIQSIQSVWKSQVLFRILQTFKNLNLPFVGQMIKSQSDKCLAQNESNVSVGVHVGSSLMKVKDTHISWIIISLWQRFCVGDWDLWCFLWSTPEQIVEQTIERPVFETLPWRSLWRHCNGQLSNDKHFITLEPNYLRKRSRWLNLNFNGRWRPLAISDHSYYRKSIWQPNHVNTLHMLAYTISVRIQLNRDLRTWCGKWDSNAWLGLP